jgi:GT2 family glycosyltransferase
MKHKLTALIVTFLRDGYLCYCVKTLKTAFPDVDLMVGDNGYPSEEKARYIADKRGIYMPLEFDCGICRARNSLVGKITTPYTLIGDDDFAYSEEAKLNEMVEFLDNHPEFDLVGGRIRENGAVKNYQGFLDIGENYLKIIPLDLEGRFENDGIDYIECDLTFNFFVARTEVLKEVRWDENIKVAYEHSDYFISLKKAGKRVVFSPAPIVEHKPEICAVVEPKYTEYRSRQSDKEYYFKKHNLDYVVDIRGNKDWLKKPVASVDGVDFLIKTINRYDCLGRLLNSILEYYPKANVYVADDGRYDEKFYEPFLKIMKLKVFKLPFDTGLSAGRNFLFDNTPNDYKLILDDDFIFTAKTNIWAMVQVMNSDSMIGVVGGSLWQDNERHYEGDLVIKQDTLFYMHDKEYWRECNGIKYRLTHLVWNFALVRKWCWQDNKWDERFKISGEHTDFFLRLNKTKWKVAYVPSVMCNHYQKYNSAYRELRRRTDYWPLLLKKHNIKRLVEFEGWMTDYNGTEVARTWLNEQQKIDLFNSL